MPLLETKGAASAQGFGMTLQQGPVNYIEDVFSTWLYTGNGSTQTINNGIDLAGKGGLVWTKSRSGAFSHGLTDTVRGAGNGLYSNTTQAQGTSDVSSFTSTGFGLTFTDNTGNRNGQNYVSWTFREQPKFFDVVTWTGDDNVRSIPHSLGSTPGCVIIKPYSGDLAGGSTNWYVWHRSVAATQGMFLNLTDRARDWDSGSPIISVDATHINILANNGVISATGQVAYVNTSRAGGQQYIAYIFAHNAGGFGLTGTDNVISCGSFTTDGSGNAGVTLGYEPQWILTKRTDGTGAWGIYDTMRGWSFSAQNFLLPNTSGAEGTINASNFVPTATGFNISSPYDASANYIYIAIRRGPMRTPTTGTSVFAPFYASYSEGAAITTNFPIDLSMWKGNLNYNWSWQDRLRGTPTSTGSGGPALASNSTAAETTSFTAVGIARLDSNIGGSVSYQADSGRSNQAAYFMFRRAPGFFDEVCTQSGQFAVPHNLGVPPELIISKQRVSGGSPEWFVTVPSLGYAYLNTTGAFFGAPVFGAFTATNFTTPVIGAYNAVNYLFASCPGVSRVGSYTGNGSTQQINCGFTGGARFVMIKQTSGSGGDWVVYSSALGINAGTDSYVLFNSNTGVNAFGDTIDAFSAGFELGPNSSGNGTNENGQTYIFLAIA